MTFIAAITGVDIINNGANEIETHEYIDDWADIACTDRNGRAYNPIDDV